MTHKDIYIKLIIEYNKTNTIQPDFLPTEYEVATALDKAYKALISRKVTGNNPRRVPLEGDLKSIADLLPLIVTAKYRSGEIRTSTIDNNLNNMLCVDLPSDFLYFVGCDIRKKFDIAPIDQIESGSVVYRRMPVKLITHDMSEGFKASSSNIPWIKTPVCYIQDNDLYVMFDSYDLPEKDFCELTYIKEPYNFVKDLDLYEETTSYFDGPGGDVEFELNETMAEELINLAISFILENTESPRLNTKLNMIGLES